jgi:ferredoxin--NADP+ reductase
MVPILSKQRLGPSITEIVVSYPRVARKAQPGQFVIVMGDERSERVPLTIADFDRDEGTITLVIMAAGASTAKLQRFEPNDRFHAMIGPLGHPSEPADYGTVVMVAGGVGAAPVYSIARAMREVGNRVLVIQGARTKDLLFWCDRLEQVGDGHIITTDDGSAGRSGLVTEPLGELLRAGLHEIGCVYTIGPTVMMRACAEMTRPLGIKTVASLNTIMVDGTGMCGGCRVRVGGESKFTCVDGPEFDAHAIDWDNVLSRRRMYHEPERCALDRYIRESEGETTSS